MMKPILFVIVFFCFCYNTYAQTNSSKHIDLPQTQLQSEACRMRPPSKYHNFDKDERVEWDYSDKTCTGVIISLCDTERCLVKLDTNNTTIKLYYSSLKHCSYCYLTKNARIQWWKDSDKIYTGIIVDIKNKKNCFVRLYEDSSILNFDLSHTDVLPCTYCYFHKGDRVKWLPPSKIYTEWYGGTVIYIPKDRSTCFIKPDYDTNAVIDFSLLENTPLEPTK